MAMQQLAACFGLLAAVFVTIASVLDSTAVFVFGIIGALACVTLITIDAVTPPPPDDENAYTSGGNGE
jgi:hypothetical protein